MVTNKSLVYAKLPKGYPVPGQDLIIRDSELDTAKAPDGGIIVKNLSAPPPNPHSPHLY